MTRKPKPSRHRPRLDKLALFRDLKYEPHAGQVEVHLSAAPRRVLACGVRWGKSKCAAMEAVAALLEPCERSIGWIVGPSYDLANRVYREVEAVLREHLESRIIECNPREHRIIVCNLGGGRSELRAKSADNPISLLGEGLDFVIVDEASRLKPEIWGSYLSERLLDRCGWAFLASTPRGPDWFYEAFELGQGEDSGYQSWNFPSWSNPYLSEAAIELERQRLPPEVFAQEYAAEFVGTPPTCRTCGFPRAEVSGYLILNDDEELRLCTSCDREVDEDGRCIRHPLPMPDGTLSTIRLIGDVGLPDVPHGELSIMT